MPQLKSLNIITPFDLEIAFEKREWTGEYILDNRYRFPYAISYPLVCWFPRRTIFCSPHPKYLLILVIMPQKLVEKKEKSNDEVLYIPTPSSELVEFHSSALDLIQEKHYTGLVFLCLLRHYDSLATKRECRNLFHSRRQEGHCLGIHERVRHRRGRRTVLMLLSDLVSFRTEQNNEEND